MKWHSKCQVCGKKESFDDTHDISHAKWKVIAWDVKTAEPACVCNECEYPPEKKEKK